MGLSVRVVETLAAPGLVQCWEELSATAAGASVFTTHAWAEAWCRTVGWRAAPAVLLMEDEAGRLVGLAPLCRQRGGAVRWLTFMGRDHVSGDHLDLVCAPEQHAACCEALLAWCAEHADTDGLLLGELPREGATVHAVRSWAGARGWPVWESEPQVVPYAELPAAFDDFVAQLSANMRYHVRRRRRALERNAAAELRTLATPAEVGAALDDLFRLHALRWARDGQSGNWGAELKQEFLREFCAALGPRGAVRATVLSCAGTRVGVLLAFHWRGTASFYQMGWEPGTSIQSPGVLLLAESIADAIAAGCTRYDFLRGDEAYKRRWTRLAAEQTTVRVGWGMAARAAIAAERFKARVRGRVQAHFGPAGWERLKRLVGAGSRGPGALATNGRGLAGGDEA